MSPTSVKALYLLTRVDLDAQRSYGNIAFDIQANPLSRTPDRKAIFYDIEPTLNNADIEDILAGRAPTALVVPQDNQTDVFISITVYIDRQRCDSILSHPNTKRK